MSQTSTSTTIHPHITYVRTSFLLKQHTNKLCAYICPIIRTSFSLSRNYWILHSFSLSILRLNMHVQTVSFTAHASALTTHTFMFYFQTGWIKNSLKNSFMFGDISLLSGMVSHTFTKYHIITSRKSLSKKSPDSNSYLQSSISTCILTSSDPTLSIVPGVRQLHSVRTSYQSPAWSNSIPANLHLNITSCSNNSFCCLKYPKLFKRQTFGASLNFP